MKNIAIFCSGKGTNLQAIINAVGRRKLNANISLVISDRQDSFSMTRAKRAGIEALFIDPERFGTRTGFEKEIMRNLKKHSIDLIVLAGFMRMLSPGFVKRYRNRILNIHPALLPSFKGTSGIKDALDYGVKITGPTVHFVDEGMDSGPIILQSAVKVRDVETEESLARRIHAKEHIIYPEAIRLVLEGKLKIAGRRVIIK